MAHKIMIFSSPGCKFVDKIMTGFKKIKNKYLMIRIIKPKPSLTPWMLSYWMDNTKTFKQLIINLLLGTILCFIFVIVGAIIGDNLYNAIS